MGILAPRSVHAWPSARPHHHQRNLLSACVCRVTFKHLLQFKKWYPKFWNPRTTFEIPTLCRAKYSIVRGEEGVPESCFEWNPNIFVNQESMQVLEPYDNFWNSPPLSGQGKARKGGPQIYFFSAILKLGAHAKFQNPRTTCDLEEEEKKEK